jgi:hypothetical protein
MALVNCTVYENVAVRGAGGSGSIPGFNGRASGDGLYSPTGGVSLVNTILESSVAAITSQGYNLFASPNAISGLVDSDLIRPYFTLGPLQDNGGPTLTHALPLDSPALDAGISAGAPAIDQRGIVRPQGFRVDIGAFELVADTPHVLMVSSNQVVTAGNDVILSVKAFGAQPLVFHWLHKGVGIAGATNATLPFTPARTNDAGFYTVVLSNSFGSVTSAPIVLEVQLPPPPHITRISTSPGGTLAIAFEAVVGRTYRLEYKHLLSEPAWTPIGADVVAASATLTIYDNPGTIPQRFYRLLRLN